MHPTRPKPPTRPAERLETARQAIAEALRAADEPLSAKDISGQVGLPEKDVYAHLEHLMRSDKGTGHRLRVVPARCKECGFEFVKRDRLTKPGKCPLCASTRIEPPRFAED
jgi:predicted Zn-ribbon and HTH transcriptional regulator